MWKPPTLTEFVVASCEPMDLSDSYKQIVDIYGALGFRDPYTDDEMIEWARGLLGDMNRWLGRMRTSLLQCEDVDAAMRYIADSYAVGEGTKVRTKSQIAFQNLKRSWIRTTSQGLAEIRDRLEE